LVLRQRRGTTRAARPGIRTPVPLAGHAAGRCRAPSRGARFVSAGERRGPLGLEYERPCRSPPYLELRLFPWWAGWAQAVDCPASDPPVESLRACLGLSRGNPPSSTRG